MTLDDALFYEVYVAVFVAFLASLFVGSAAGAWSYYLFLHDPPNAHTICLDMELAEAMQHRTCRMDLALILVGMGAAVAFSTCLFFLHEERRRWVRIYETRRVRRIHEWAERAVVERALQEAVFMRQVDAWVHNETLYEHFVKAEQVAFERGMRMRKDEKQRRVWIHC